MNLKYILSFLLLLFWSFSALAQEHSFENLFETENSKIKTKWAVSDPKNEVEAIFTGLFVFYKDFLSSQDNSKCNFHPSCSVFAIQSIQKKGTLIGILSAFDRLIRCNGMNANEYEYDPKTQLLNDPVL